MDSLPGRPSVPSAESPLQNFKDLVDYSGTLDCIHCGLCLQSCPTYRLTGSEASSPRGRIHIMRGLGEGRLDLAPDYREELDFCLMCRHCESACPAGVRFGEMMGVARDRVEIELPRGRLARLARWLGLGVVLPSRLALRLAGSGLRALQILRIDRLLARSKNPSLASLKHLPRVPPLSTRRLLPARIRATQNLSGSTQEAATKLSVNLLQGCIQAELFAHVNRATVDSLILMGVECQVPAGVTCCGSLHAHNGDFAGARRLAKLMIEGFLDGAPIVVNSAGCSAHMKELAHLFQTDDPWHARAEKFAARVQDYAEFMAPLLAERELPLEGVPSPITWDDPCHLCHAQKLRAQPRDVLAKFTGVEQVPLENSESCCGSAGVYSLLRPSDSQEIFEPKLAAFQRSGAKLLVTANPGCQMQWSSGFKRAGQNAHVVHLAELVAHSLRSQAPKA
jgi:glycolate oxidase iron-sulfur subunit